MKCHLDSYKIQDKENYAAFRGHRKENETMISSALQ